MLLGERPLPQKTRQSVSEVGARVERERWPPRCSQHSARFLSLSLEIRRHFAEQAENFHS